MHVFLRAHPSRIPQITTPSVNHLRWVGRRKEGVVIGRIHWKPAPPMIDTSDRITIGVIIFIFSFIEAIGL